MKAEAVRFRLPGDNVSSAGHGIPSLDDGVSLIAFDALIAVSCDRLSEANG